jgi:hypothetical protein
MERPQGGQERRVDDGGIEGRRGSVFSLSLEQALRASVEIL